MSSPVSGQMNNSALDIVGQELTIQHMHQSI